MLNFESLLEHNNMIVQYAAMVEGLDASFLVLVLLEDKSILQMTMAKANLPSL